MLKFQKKIDITNIPVKIMKYAKRNENQDVYIDLCFDSPQNIIEKNMEIDIKKLKSDEEYRNKYLSEKEVAYNNYIREKTKKQI